MVAGSNPVRPFLYNMKETIDIREHILVPKHILLTEEEAKNILAKYNVNRTQLPRISKKDPAIQELGAKPGDIIKIIRKSVTAGKSAYYRVIVDA